ncbi:signal peptide peptidase SppA [Balneolaceae bacterium YR4-1]|uniref:Signal peptide peptidase SppA n=1 Tax=Halalkalibaculum roseum TaxID=2709311 RepID=A0A6M1SXK1_9BACT|nr:signal peptide peptidase SppA [Halalkalibaculum roseum]NGP76998.1 signal peptide peptidase SppA [Halalkalibaculum roseum]
MKFFQTLIAATLGTLIALFLVFIVLFITLSSTSSEPEPYIRDNTVLKLELSGTLPAQARTNPFDELFSQAGNNKVSLETLKENLAKAKSHDKIQGVWLEIDFMSEGWANLEEAHRMISAFRDSSDKFVYASTNDLGLNEQGYYLATAADSIFSPPESFFEFDGFYNQVTFLTGLFEKIGIEAQVSRSGKYKSAVEPYIRKDLSEESKYQLREILNKTSGTFVNAVSQKTGKSPSEINGLMNSEPKLNSSFGYQNGLIDSLIYADQVEAQIKRRLGLEESATLQTVSNKRYARVTQETAGLEGNNTSDRIAVIYASGPILPEISSNSPFDNEQYITTGFFEKQLEDIREDDNVKALVVRINSPGGSGSTSDAIWRMLQETKKEIPVIVSMGPVAASGGYYIAMAADSIVADPTTITGSIGVFATKLNTKQLFNEELGITFDEVKSHDYADWLLPTNDFTDSEEKAFNDYVNRFYDTFITKVAEARGMTKEQVDSVAQGRVWTGEAAKEQNLVDVIGGMDTAMGIAAQKAGIEAYDVVTYPKPKDLYQLLMGSAQTQAKAMIGESWFGTPYAQDVAKKLSILKQQRALALFPYEITIQ